MSKAHSKTQWLVLGGLILLCLAVGGIGGGAFGLYQGQGFAVVAPQHVVYIASARGVGHTDNLNFGPAGLVDVPPRFF